MIQLIHVSKQYDNRLALSDVTFDIGKGEFVLLMGPSGAGKSTLLRMLIGAERVRVRQCGPAIAGARYFSGRYSSKSHGGVTGSRCRAQARTATCGPLYRRAAA